jgi:hypothetical protein
MPRLLHAGRNAIAAAATQATGVYRPREPLESDFHRLVRERFDEFREGYGERYARQYGYWRPIVD